MGTRLTVAANAVSLTIPTILEQASPAAHAPGTTDEKLGHRTQPAVGRDHELERATGERRGERVAIERIGVSVLVERTRTVSRTAPRVPRVVAGGCRRS